MKKENKISFRHWNTSKGRWFKVVKILVFGICVFAFLYTFAADLLILVTRQTATSVGSNNGLITFTYTGGLGQTYYVEKGSNSAIIGNYLKGYYYDSMMGFFQLDWSSEPSKNVYIISSTEKCGSSYGYKLGGYANSKYFGFMQFNYSPDIFVYYCEGDKKLHGYGYNKYVGFQSFEGIGFELLSSSGSIGVSSSNIFVNDTTSIDKKNAYTGGDSRYSSQGIGADIFSIDDTQESIIYIIR